MGTLELNKTSAVATARELAPILKAIADEYRLAILLMLAERDYTVTELTTELGIGQTLVSHHLSALRKCHLVVATPVGRSNRYAICCDAIAEPIRYLVGLGNASPNVEGGPR